MNIADNDNRQWDDFEFNAEDLLYIQLRYEGKTDVDIDARFAELDRQANHIIRTLRAQGVSDDAIDEHVAEICRIVEHADYSKYQMAWLRQKGLLGESDV